MTGVFILSHIEKYASISFFTDEGEKDMYSEYIFDLSDKNVSDYVVTNFERVCWSEDDKRFVAIKIAG